MPDLRPTIRMLLAAAISMVVGHAIGPALAADAALLERLREADRRVATVAQRLATHAPPICPAKRPWPGLVLHSAGQYGGADRAAAARQFGLGAGISVLAVVADGPAARAGVADDDRLIAIDDVPVAPGDGYAPVAAAWAALDAALGRGTATLVIERGQQRQRIALAAPQGCASQVELVPATQLDSLADGSIVAIDSALVEFTRSDDELAIAIGHELAHNILGHAARLDAAGVSRGLARILPGNARRIRETETEADYLALYLAARAGYDIKAAPAFWRRFGRDGGDPLLGDGTHPGSRARAEAAVRTIAEIAAKRAAGQPLLPEADRITAPPTGDTSRRSEAPPR